MKTPDKLNELRKRIDEVDAKICKLIQERMKITYEVGRYKSDNHSKVYDRNREDKKITHIKAICEEYPEEISEIYKLIMQISRFDQYKLIYSNLEEIKAFTSLDLVLCKDDMFRLQIFLKLIKVKYDIEELHIIDDSVNIKIKIYDKEGAAILKYILDQEFNDILEK